MEFIDLNQDCYYFHSAVNIGYVKNGEYGMIIDAGIDKQAIKKVVKMLEANHYPITHLFITHAHADHYGGAAHLQAIKDVYTYAPKIESSILTYPILEPLYLFQGNNPLPELRNKFLEGEAITVDEVVDEGTYFLGETQFQCIFLPGHSIHQLGVLFNEVLFAADSYFSEDQLNKHRIPFIIDAEQTLHSLEKLKKITCKGALPGHGIYEEGFLATVEANIHYHQEVLSSLSDLLTNHSQGLSLEQIVQKMCEKWDVKIVNVSSWLLFRTAVTAYITKLIRDDLAEISVGNYLLWVKGK